MKAADLDLERSFVEREETFHEAARAAVGYDDFGDPSYREGLHVLLQAWDEEAHFTAHGRFMAQREVLSLLERRLRAERMWREKPAILTQPIRRPIVICGLIRTGSTALHYLMGQDPGIQVLQYWLAENPQPRPPRSEWAASSDFQASAAGLDAMYAADPGLKAIHFMMADGPDECGPLLAQCFTDDRFEVNASAPSYSAWYQKADMRPTYRRHRKLLQLIGSTDPQRRWLIKYPVHVRHLDALFDAYPDACVVQTHRDPTRVLFSYASLIAGFRSLNEEGIDIGAETRRQLDLWAKGLEAGIAARKGRDPRQFHDLHFRDFMADPIGSVKRIYAQFDQELSPQGELALRDWHTSNPQHKHGRHEYSQEVGVSREEMWERFGTYMKHFGMERE